MEFTVTGLWLPASSGPKKQKKKSKINKNAVFRSFSWPTVTRENGCALQWFGSWQSLNLFKLCPRLKQLCRHLALLLSWSAITEVSWAGYPPPNSFFFFFPALPQPSLLYKCQLTISDTDGERKHRRTAKGREPPTGVRKQEDSTHTVQERILPDNIINSFILFCFF